MRIGCPRAYCIHTDKLWYKKIIKEWLQNPTPFALTLTLTLTITKGSIFLKLCFVLIFMYMHVWYPSLSREKYCLFFRCIYNTQRILSFSLFIVVCASIILLISILNHSININDVRLKRMLVYSIHNYAHHILFVYIRTSLT